jgi:hypothetical protein
MEVMSFTYLHLFADEGDIYAEVRNSGELTFSSLGGPNSRPSKRPFAVFALEEFTGLSAIPDRQLLDELFRRYTTKEIASRLNLTLSTDELIELLRQRL